MLTAEQVSEFERRGYVHLPGIFDRPAVDALANDLWSHLETHRNMRRDDPGTWDVDAPYARLKPVKEQTAYQSLTSPALHDAVDDLLGPDSWQPPRNWGGFLVSCPDCSPDPWNLPAKGWHVDYHFTSEPHTLFGLTVFTFLTKVGPRGGGTLVASGTHTLVDRFVVAKTEDERRAGFAKLRDEFQASDPWLAELTTRAGEPPNRRRIDYFMDRPHEIDGVSVQVAQLCGAPGDVVLAHPWILHVTSPNAGPTPRFMLAKNLYVNRSVAVS